ncbi:unnamed protein product [Euphydryas editha]|uniref:Uncharacterized protein n=1 Tax=Euphydryas editha TaxID=104508 RepID=A0AAU9U2D1_EUPED|nr:unnamed protein product [Euphydryas editha]
MAVIGQVSIFSILVVILFHFGHSHKYADHKHDQNIEELSQVIKDWIHPKYVKGRYPYEKKQYMPQINSDDFNVRPHHDDYSWDKSEKPTLEGSGWTLVKNSNEDHVKNQNNDGYDRSDEADTNRGQGSKNDVKNQSNEWYDKNGKVDPNSGYVDKDDVKNEKNEGYNKNNEATIDNGQAGYKDNEKVLVPELEHKESSIENGKWSNPIETTTFTTETSSSASVSLPDKDNLNDIPIDVSKSIENPYNIPLTNEIEQETVKLLDNLPASLEPNLLDSFSSSDINIASGTQLPSLNQESFGLNSAVPNINLDPTLALNSIPSIPASENYENNGVLYNNRMPYNSYVPYSPYDVPGFSIPSLNSPSNFAPNGGSNSNTASTANLFNNYYPTNPAYSEFYNNPNFSQWDYETVQLNNGQIALIPKYWSIFPTNNPFLPTVGSRQIFPPTVGSRQIFPPTVGSRQIFPPNNQIYESGQNLYSIQNYNDKPGSVNWQYQAPGVQNLPPQWLLYNNQYVKFRNSQDYIEGKSLSSDDKQSFQ